MNDTTSTSGCVVNSAPTALSEDVSTLTTPGGMSVASATSRPSASVAHGVSGAPFRTTVHPAASAGASFAERELDRVVVRGDGADDAGGFPLDPAVVTAGERVALAQVLDEVVSVEQVGVPLHDVGRALELRSVRDRDRRADLVHEDLAELFRVVDQRLVELAQAAQRGAPDRVTTCRVERAPRRGDRAIGVGDARVGRGSEHVLRRRRDRLVRRAVLGGDQLPVDEQPVLVPHRHALPPHDCAGVGPRRRRQHFTCAIRVPAGRPRDECDRVTSRP